MRSIFSSEKAGWNCQTDDNGATMCQRFEINEAGEQIATGTNFTVITDPNNGCKPMLSNPTILDDDQKAVEKIVSQAVKGCKVGLATGSR